MEEKEVVNVGELLNETIIGEIDNLVEAEPEQRKQLIDGIDRLYKLRIEENKAVDDFYNNEQRRNMEKTIQEGRNELDLQMHQDKMKLEFERLELERLNIAKDIEVKEAQVKTEKKKMWLGVICQGVVVAAWLSVNYGVMNIEKTGSIRSKAFSANLPKLKFW